MRSLYAWWAHPWVRHLRLGFNVLLAPIFLWGVLLAGGTLDRPEVWAGFVAFHVFLYGGANAFNSFYDRDEGPIGGMLRPPAVDPGLLPFSLAFQFAGAPFALWAGWDVLVVWLVLAAVFAAYSHPAVRWKAHPAAALAAIAFGQGGIGFLGGWFSAADGWASLGRPVAWWGAATTVLLLTGLYIVTQSYQVAEDRRRGDQTLPVLLGARRALRIAVALLLVGGALIAWFASVRFGVAWGAALLVGTFAGGVWLGRFAARFREDDVEANFHRVMAFATVASGSLTVFLAWHLIG